MTPESFLNDSMARSDRLEGGCDLDPFSRCDGKIFAFRPDLVVDENLEFGLAVSLVGCPNPGGRINAVQRNPAFPSQSESLTANEERVSKTNVHFHGHHRGGLLLHFPGFCLLDFDLWGNRGRSALRCLIFYGEFGGFGSCGDRFGNSRFFGPCGRRDGDGGFWRGGCFLGCRSRRTF